MKTKSLAPVQRKTLEFLRSWIGDRGYAPTLRDISKHIGVKSTSTAHFHLGRLEEKGFISRGEDGEVELAEGEQMQDLYASSGVTEVPLLGFIAAGSPIEAIEDNSVMVDIPSSMVNSRGEVYCLQVTGDSMVNAHILDGDIIVVRRSDTALDGEIVVALLENGDITLKTLRRLKGGKVMLLSQNSLHAPITVDRVKVQGTLIGLIREM